jgi:hypothetical protein
MDFNLESYRQLLVYAKELGFGFEPAESTRSILLRHDVDLDLASCMAMAIIESEMEINSIYCVMTENPIYDLGTPESYVYLQELTGMGHQIGLHFDGAISAKSPLGRQFAQLEHILGQKVTYFSQHQPTLNGFYEEEIKERINLYDYDHYSKMKYISDSCMLPREDFKTTLETNSRIQILVHPEFWVLGGKNLVEFGKNLKLIKPINNWETIDNLVSEMVTTVLNRKKLDQRLRPNK